MPCAQMRLESLVFAFEFAFPNTVELFAKTQLVPQDLQSVALRRINRIDVGAIAAAKNLRSRRKRAQSESVGLTAPVHQEA